MAKVASATDNGTAEVTSTADEAVAEVAPAGDGVRDRDCVRAGLSHGPGHVHGGHERDRGRLHGRRGGGIRDRPGCRVQGASAADEPSGRGRLRGRRGSAAKSAPPRRAGTVSVAASMTLRCMTEAESTTITAGEAVWSDSAVEVMTEANTQTEVVAGLWSRSTLRLRPSKARAKAEVVAMAVAEVVAQAVVETAATAEVGAENTVAGVEAPAAVATVVAATVEAEIAARPRCCSHRGGRHPRSPPTVDDLVARTPAFCFFRVPPPWPRSWPTRGHDRDRDGDRGRRCSNLTTADIVAMVKPHEPTMKPASLTRVLMHLPSSIFACQSRWTEER